MERLTRRNAHGRAMLGGNRSPAENAMMLPEIIERLAAYEDAEEQGRLVVLPCKVGDTVYVLCAKEIREYTVYHIDVFADEIFIIASFDDGKSSRVCTMNKTCYLTREEAEKALEGMG